MSIDLRRTKILATLGPAVTVFGSARTTEGEPAYELARNVGRLLLSHLDGPVRPALFMTGPVQRLAEPITMVHAEGRVVQRKADVRLRLYSRAFAAAALIVSVILGWNITLTTMRAE